MRDSPSTPAIPLGLRMALPVVALAVACAGPSTSTAPAAAPPPITVALDQPLKTLHPLFYETSLEAEVGENLFLSLVQQTFDGALVYTPGLAEGWAFSEDHRDLAFTLRTDNRWSDGAPVTARDVAFTYEVVAAGVTSFGSYLQHLDPVAPVEVLDDAHVTFHFDGTLSAENMLTQAGTLALLPAHRLAAVPPDKIREEAFAQAPLTNGPWAVEGWAGPSGFSLVPNPAWAGPEEMAPQLDRIRFAVLTEGGPRLLALDKGEVDLAFNIGLTEAGSLAGREELRLHRRGWRAWMAIGWNQRDPAHLDADHGGPRPDPRFADVQVRRALAAAIDVDGLIDGLLTLPDGQRFGRRAVGNVTPELSLVHADDVEPIPHNAALAGAALAALGWDDTDGDGLRDKDGVPFRFTLLYLEGREQTRLLAERVAGQLREVGVGVELVARPLSTYDSALRSGDFDAVLLQWSAQLNIEPWDFWHSEGRKNFVGFSDPGVDELIVQGTGTPDPAAARSTWIELQHSIYDQQPYAFLCWVSDVIATRSRLEGYQPSVLSRFYRMHRWHRAEEGSPGH